MASDPENVSEGEVRRRKSRLAILAVSILVAGAGLAVLFILTRPKAEVRQRPKSTPIVEVSELKPESVRVRIEAMGTVTAADEVPLQAEISGRITKVSPEMVEGGFAQKGAVLIEVDDRDYRLSVQQKRAALQSARSELELELGRQNIAAAEWELFNERDQDETQKKDLALRKPQLKAARAAVESAVAALEQAEINLERTKIRAPFNGVIAEALADPGDRAYPGAVLARLIATDTFWVKASVRADQLKWLSFKDAQGQGGSPVIVYPTAGGERDGKLIKLFPELEQSGRMAQVLVEVDDPLLYKSTKPGQNALLLNEFVRIVILGKEVKNVIRIPRTALREGSQIWLLDIENRLRIVKPEILWSTSNEVFVKNIFEPGARMIVSNLGAPVEGMSLSLDGEAAKGKNQKAPPGQEISK
jgi:RND family efflux transporter MFP subunit